MEVKLFWIVQPAHATVAEHPARYLRPAEENHPEQQEWQ
jgi:hypothetical protein